MKYRASSLCLVKRIWIQEISSTLRVFVMGIVILLLLPGCTETQHNSNNDESLAVSFNKLSYEDITTNGMENWEIEFEPFIVGGDAKELKWFYNLKFAYKGTDTIKDVVATTVGSNVSAKSEQLTAIQTFEFREVSLPTGAKTVTAEVKWTDAKGVKEGTQSFHLIWS